MPVVHKFFWLINACASKNRKWMTGFAAYRYWRLFSWAREEGIFPVSKLSEISIVWSFGSLPNSEGIGPDKLLFCRNLHCKTRRWWNHYIIHYCSIIYLLLGSSSTHRVWRWVKFLMLGEIEPDKLWLGAALQRHQILFRKTSAVGWSWE